MYLPKHKYAVEFLFPFIYKSNTQMSIIHCTIRFLAGKAAGIFIQSWTISTGKLLFFRNIMAAIFNIYNKPFALRIWTYCSSCFLCIGLYLQLLHFNSSTLCFLLVNKYSIKNPVKHYNTKFLSYTKSWNSDSINEPEFQQFIILLHFKFYL